MDGRPTWTDCDEARFYVVPNVLLLVSPRDLVSRPDKMGENVPHTAKDQVNFKQNIFLTVMLMLSYIY